MKINDNVITISTEKDVKHLESGLAQIELQYVPFLVSTLTTLINQLIIDPIHDKMRRVGVSSKIIDRTYLDVKAEKNGQIITFHIKSDYLSESGFEVARMIEYGRKAYFIHQKQKRMTWIKDGIRKYAKRHPEGIGVKIPIKKGLHAIMDTIISGQPKVQKELNRRTKIWYKAILRDSL